MSMPDLDSIKALGSALSGLGTGIGALVGVADKINNAQLRQEMNGKIADLQSVVINARTQSMEVQEKYEAALKEVRALKAKLDQKSSEQFLHGVWWRTFVVDKEEFDPEVGDNVLYGETHYEGPYCPLCKETNERWVHLKRNGQTAKGGTHLVYECEIHHTEYEAPDMCDY